MTQPERFDVLVLGSGTGGTDRLAYGVLMLAGAPYGRFADAILAHPTTAEGLGMLFSNVPRRSLQHVAPERAA